MHLKTDLAPVSFQLSIGGAIVSKNVNVHMALRQVFVDNNIPPDTFVINSFVQSGYVVDKVRADVG